MTTNIKIVIQCAGTKIRDAGCMRDADKTRILFVADPRAAPPCEKTRYARPDDIADNKTTWREKLLAYNQCADNLFKLSPAGELYDRSIYGNLVGKYGEQNVFILSAGWGLIRADFLTPNYDITFSKAPKVEPYKRRGKKDRYHDLCMLPSVTDDLVFFGGKDYQSLFCKLTANYPGRRVIFYNSVTMPDAPGCTLRTHQTSAKTNWHYQCAADFIKGNIKLPAGYFGRRERADGRTASQVTHVSHTHS